MEYLQAGRKKESLLLCGKNDTDGAMNGWGKFLLIYEKNAGFKGLEGAFPGPLILEDEFDFFQSRPEGKGKVVGGLH